MSVRSWKLPGRAALPLKLIGGVSTVKDQRETRPERPEAGVRNHDPAAMATQKTPRAQPMTLVQDQSRPARPHLQPASKTASMTSPIVRSPRGVAQFNPRDDPRSVAAISNCQTRRPPVSQTSSPRLPCLPPERARIGGPTRARQPASVERLDSRASGGQVSRPLWMSRLKPQPSAAASRIALVTACSGELAVPGELLARLALMGSCSSYRGNGAGIRPVGAGMRARSGGAWTPLSFGPFPPKQSFQDAECQRLARSNPRNRTEPVPLPGEAGGRRHSCPQRRRVVLLR